MDRLSIISDSVHWAEYIGGQVAGIFQTQSYCRHDLACAMPAKYTVVDIDLEDSSHLPELRVWLKCRPKNGKTIFAVDRGVRHQTVQAYAIGATDVVDRPVDRKALLTNFDRFRRDADRWRRIGGERSRRRVEAQLVDEIAAEKNSTIVFPLPLEFLQGFLQRRPDEPAAAGTNGTGDAPRAQAPSA